MAVSEVTPAADEYRALLEAVIENIPAGVLVMDGEGRAVLASRQALEMLGIDSLELDALANWRDTEAHHLDGRPVQPDEWPMARTLAGGETVNAEKYEVVVSGRPLILEIASAPLVSSTGQRSGGLAIFRDVTTREQSERAERDFVTNAAHELQSPLASIVSAIDVLQAGAKDGPERELFLSHIERESDRLARLVRALLILASSQTGVEAPKDQLVALCPLLHDVAAGLKLAAKVRVQVDCDENLAMVTNRELVEQALMNLAENAAKQTSEGSVVLSASERSDGRVELAVSDTGAGIAAAERSKVFQRFYRSEANGVAGFGLGLAIVREAAEALGGDLELDSAVGTGTTVRLRLPGAARLVEQ